MKPPFVAPAFFLASMILAGQTLTPAGGPLSPHYHVGETLNYHMSATNDELRYTADVSCIPKEAPSGSYFVECRWTGMTRNGQLVTLTPETAQFRELVSTDPRWVPSPPAPSKADPRLQGPTLDFFTFYVDLWLANRIGVLQKPRDHFYMPMPQVGSWADGTRVLIGKSQADYDLNLQSIDPVTRTTLLFVHHVPPPHPNLQFPAQWMQMPVADTPNNWVEVMRLQDGKYQAGAGKEIFDDSITVSTEDGTILSAIMDNPVETSSRICDDATLTKCGEAQLHTIRRHIEITLQR